MNTKTLLWVAVAGVVVYLLFFNKSASAATSAGTVAASGSGVG
jgi:hypothetical protein